MTPYSSQYYHRRWLREDTVDNFFKWYDVRSSSVAEVDCLLRLDRGGGKDLSLPECPREQLEKEVSNVFC